MEQSFSNSCQGAFDRGISFLDSRQVFLPKDHSSSIAVRCWKTDCSNLKLLSIREETKSLHFLCVCYSPHRCPLIQGFYLKKAHRHTSHTRSVCPTKRQCDKEQVQRVRSDLCPCRWKVSALTHCYRALPHMEGTAYVCVCTVWPELQSRQ